jgi:serine/threonine protein kinase
LQSVAPKIVKLLVEKIESEESNVLIIGGQRYDKIQVVNQAGRGVLSMEDSDAFPLVVVKERKRNPKMLKPLKSCSHDNVIALRAIFYHTDSVSTVYDYELGAMTLASVASCPSVEFSDADIATASRDILNALQFIHSELKIAHGDVRDGNIMLTLSGGVKLGTCNSEPNSPSLFDKFLANLGDSMLNDVTLKDRDRDLKAVGTVAMNVADRATKIVRPDVAHWDSDASKILRDFISQTSQQGLKTLLQVCAPSKLYERGLKS